ncbi:S9 family peptidase [Sphingomonas sp. QA11]|uniref:alpha/beta hydrolase family protein n=1 Tax=Sphingomonas sp. QA11 TaxID=2950605 RepID=UPI00234BA7C9|nr:S9 family peptidase [Sphingomonas sp. QA11]WCM25771.1 S9 family peptidase [Sphingomonas sp. QA11]
MIMRAVVLGASALLLSGSAAIAQQAAPPVVAPAAPADAPIPAELFGRLPFMEAPQLSPDGTRAAARLAVNGTQRLAIIPLDDSSKMVQINQGEIDLNSWTWVNDSWLVARIGTNTPVEGDTWYVRRAISISADGKKMQVLGKQDAAQGADDILWIARDGSPHVLLAMQTSIYSDRPGFWPEVRDFDVSTGKGKRVLAPSTDVMDWYADSTGTVRLGIAYVDSTRTSKMLYRDRNDQTFRTVDKVRGPGASLGNVPAMFLPEPGKAIAYDDAGGFNALYNLDLASLKTGEKLFGVPGYDIDNLITGDGGTRLIGIHYTDTRARTHWFDPALADIQAKIDQAVGTRRAQIKSWSRDFKVLIVLVDSPDNPGTYYIFRQDEGVMHVFASVNEGLGRKAYGPVSSIRYKARDGLEIEAILTRPKGGTGKNLPLIVMPHGGPFARDDESWDWWAQFLASRGYAVIQPNYRGSSGYGTAFSEKGNGQWGLAMQDDLIDAIKWAAKEGIADPRRVCIVGGSYGGYAALRAAQRDHGTYRCAISYAGVSDMAAILRHDGSFLNGGRSKDYWRSQSTDLKGASPINFATDFSIPVLVMHGKVDARVPVKQSREMVEKLKAAGKTYRYIEQPLGDHHFSREADRIQFLKEMEAFLKEYNPA